MTTDELFSVPHSTDPLTLARKRLEDAQEAYDAADEERRRIDEYGADIPLAIETELHLAKQAVLCIEGKMLEQLKGKS